MLALAYAVSVAYYLKLLAEFALKDVTRAHDAIALSSVTLLVASLVALALSGGLQRVERVAHAAVSLKIGVIAGMLAALGAYWAVHRSVPIKPPTAPLSRHSVSILLGLLITVQGFEISRFLGQSYSAQLRIRTMRHAQWSSAAIYLGFIILLTPFLASAAHTQGVTGILDVMRTIGWGLAGLVLLGAAFSQLSAAVADSIGSAFTNPPGHRHRLPGLCAFLCAAVRPGLGGFGEDTHRGFVCASRLHGSYGRLRRRTVDWRSRRVGITQIRLAAPRADGAVAAFALGATSTPVRRTLLRLFRSRFKSLLSAQYRSISRSDLRRHLVAHGRRIIISRSPAKPLGAVLSWLSSVVVKMPG